MNQETKTAIGCLGGAIYFGVVMPLWFSLVFYLLSAALAPDWAWSVYWAYIPAQFIALILIQLGKQEG